MLLSFVGYGQQTEKTVSGSFTHLPFEQFASQLEAQTNYHFYFDPAAVDSLYVTLQAQGQPIRAVLAQALQGTPFHFAIDDENRVIVSAGAAINPALPGEFFQPKATDGATVAQTEEPVAPGPVGRSRYVSVSEYKVYEIGAGGGSGWVTLAGHIRDQKSGEPVIGASIYSESPNIGASTDQFGYYSLTLPTGRYDLKIRGVGIKNTRR